MNWKIALALSALVTPAAAFPSCGTDDCDRSLDHVSECQSNLSSSASSSSGQAMTPACTGTYLCQSQCINSATCDEINGNLPAYTCCVVGCESNNGSCLMGGSACKLDADCCCGACSGGRCATP